MELNFYDKMFYYNILHEFKKFTGKIKFIRSGLKRYAIDR